MSKRTEEEIYNASRRVCSNRLYKTFAVRGAPQADIRTKFTLKEETRSWSVVGTCTQATP